MENTRFDVDHMAQLREIERARLKRGEPGLRDPVVQLIRELTMGPAAAKAVENLRESQARRLFDLKFGDVLDCSTFEQYLDATGKDSFEPVPMVSAFPATHIRLFGTQGITIADGRVAEKVGLKEYLRLVGLAYGGENDTFEPFDPKRAKSGIRWMIGQDGYRNRNRKPSDCRKTFAPFEVGMDAIEGGAVYAQNPSVIGTQQDPHYLYLSGSVHRRDRGRYAYLGLFDGKPELRWRWYGVAFPEYGTASRGE